MGDACIIKTSQGSRLCTEGCAATRVGWEVTVGAIIHDGMFDLRPNGAGGGQLRRKLWARFGKICCQESINGPKLGEQPNLNSKGAIKIKGLVRE